MKLREIGEFGLIDKISSQFGRPEGTDTIGIGDDCAVIPFTSRSVLLITTDMLVEGTHFILSEVKPRDLGYKSLAVNLSDIAAKGGVPRATFLSWSLPSNLDVSWVDQFIAGFKELAQPFNVSLMGGDTTKTIAQISINVTVLGEVKTSNLKLRSHAKIGDIICVTGFLGDSGAGLKAIKGKLAFDSRIEKVLEAHYRPFPQLVKGAWLAEQADVHAMMDVSDGIDSDLRRIMKASNVGAQIFMNNLPISAELRSLSQDYGWDQDLLACTGGEDYCLLLTVDPGSFPSLSESFRSKFDTPLYDIGVVIRPEAGLRYLKDNREVLLAKSGYDHFEN